MIKDLIVNLKVGSDRDPAADYAVSIAAAFEARIAGVAFAYDPVVPPSVMGGIPGDFIDAQRAESAKSARSAIARFEAMAKRNGLSAETHELNATLAGAADIFSRMARRFDLAVIGQQTPEAPAPEEFIIEGALFGSGRPAVIVPYIQKDPFKLDRTVVCWDGGRTAARAIGDAMPLLSRAKLVELLIVATGRAKSDELPGADMAEHLAHHGLKVELKRLVAADVDVPNVVLSYVADNSADFIVMGGYGHSRLREFILGGATRGILTSMTVPVMMSH
jgi:nucleotide-binding universal stress UspA family protein